MSVERARSGNGWMTRWRENGRGRSRLFRLKRDAEAFDREIQRRRQLGALAVQQLTTREGVTLDQWIEQRWVPEHAIMLEQSTRERYANVYECHVWRSLGDLPIAELTVSRVSQWQAELVKAGVNPGTIDKCRTFLSSVLRHAAEREAIPGNPLSLVRAPKQAHRDAIQPLSPTTVEAIRRAMLDPPAREIAASRPAQRKRVRYELPAPGTPQTRQRDALIVSLLAYCGLRPGELRALRFADMREKTLLVERACNPDGSIKATKTEHRRTVRLLSAPAQDLREYRLATSRPPETSLVLVDDDGKPWDKSAWDVWRADRWVPACRAVGLDPAPRPYDLRHGFASLLLAEGRQPLYVAKQLGHSLAVLLNTYAHLIDEYAEREPIDAEPEIATARKAGVPSVRRSVS